MGQTVPALHQRSGDRFGVVEHRQHRPIAIGGVPDRVGKRILEGMQGATQVVGDGPNPEIDDPIEIEVNRRLDHLLARWQQSVPHRNVDLPGDGSPGAGDGDPISHFVIVVDGAKRVGILPGRIGIQR